EVVLVERDRLSAELAHGNVERHARARRRLLEDEDQDVVLDAFRLELGRHALPGRLHGMGGIDDAPQRTRIDLVEIQEMSNSGCVGHGRRPAPDPEGWGVRYCWVR